MIGFWKFFLDKRQFSYVLIGVLVIAGAFSIIRIPKENQPAIVIPYGIVVTVLPGASSSDVETLVTDKLENQISGISNIDTMVSTSRDGVSQITVQFLASADLNQSIQNLRDAVAKATPELPSDAESPDVSRIDFNNQPVIVASISGDLPPTEFSALGKTIADTIKTVSGVSTVNVAGIPDHEVTIVVNKDALLQYNLRLIDVVSAVRAANAALPSGSITIDNINYNVIFKGGITDPAQLASIAVGSTHEVPIYLRDVALISDGLATPTTYSRLSMNGKPSNQAITLTIYKQSSARISEVAESVREKFAELQKNELSGFDVYISPSTDQGLELTKQLTDLVKTGVETVALVVLVLLITIGWREAVVAALSVPLSFLIAFLALYLTGNTLNFISFFALILAVGILVDSGIVVTEAIHARMKIYGSPLRAATAALHDYAWPLIAGTMTSVAVFVPLFFISGIVGKYIAGIPYTLIFVLIASIFVALGIVPLIAILFTGTKRASRLEELQEQYTDRAVTWYKRMLRRLLQNSKVQRIFLWVLGVTFVAALALPVVGLIRVVFFAQSDQDFVYINIEGPQGTSLAKTDLVVREVEELLYADTDIFSFQTTVGQSSELSGSGSSGSNLANITVNLPQGHTTTSTDVLQKLQAKFASITEADVQVLQASNGPSSSAPIQIQFKGENRDDLIRAADAGKQLLTTISGARNITSTTVNNGTEFDLAIDRAKVSAAGLDPQTIAQTLHIAVQGAKATSITETSQDIDVIVKLNLNTDYGDPSQTTHTTLDSIKNISVVGSHGPVLLGSVLVDSLGQNSANIRHQDKKRIETVSAYPDSQTTAGEVVSSFQKRASELTLPPGVEVTYGGESEDMTQSFQDMLVALIAGLVLMFMILIISFNSFRYTGYLLVIVPLSLIGVLGGLALTGQPLSFTSILGVIALGGVIINHAIILMDSMVHHLAEETGKPLIDIVIDSSATRLRPIVLTTITTVIGMVPLSLTNATWGPLAYAIMFGLTFAIILTLALVPMLFYRASVRAQKA